MALIICDARFRERGNPTQFDTDVTLILRKGIVDDTLNKTYTRKNFGDKKIGVQKEVWVKYQLTAGGKFLEKTFPENTTPGRKIDITLP